MGSTGFIGTFGGASGGARDCAVFGGNRRCAGQVTRFLCAKRNRRREREENYKNSCK